MINFKAISLFSLAVFFFFSTSAFSDEKDFLLEFGNRQNHGSLNSKIPLRLMVWNVQKIENKALYHDFKLISESAPLVLLQEMVSKSEIIGPLVEVAPSLDWKMTKAWKRGGGDYTGVATGSRVAPLDSVPLVSNVTEPVSFTPKSALLSYFSLSEGVRPLLVVNVHAINFVTLQNYASHLLQIYTAIRDHQGPLIVAGDFNTWSPGRRYYLNSMIQKLGMREISLPANGKFFDLDHVFVRGLKSLRVYDLRRVDSSDHVPLLMDLEFIPQAEILAAS